MHVAQHSESSVYAGFITNPGSEKPLKSQPALSRGSGIEGGLYPHVDQAILGEKQHLATGQLWSPE